MVPADRRRLDVLAEPRHRPTARCLRRCRTRGCRRATRCCTGSPMSTTRTAGFATPPVCASSTRPNTSKVKAAFEAYQDTIPKSKKFREVAYDVKDIVGRTGFGIGSAGLPSYNVLIEGFNQALDNDIVLSMKQGNVAAPSRVVDDEARAQVLQAPGAPHRGIAAGAAGARRSPARLHRDRRGRFRRRGAVAVRVRPGLERTDRTRRADRGDRTARPCGGQGALCR